MKIKFLVSLTIMGVGCATQNVTGTSKTGEVIKACPQPINEYKIKIKNEDKEKIHRVFLPNGVGEKQRIECSSKWIDSDGTEREIILVSESGMFEISFVLTVTDNSWNLRGTKVSEHVYKGKYYHESWGAIVSESEFEIYR